MIIYNWTDEPVYFRDDPVSINPIVLHKHPTYGAWYHNGNSLNLSSYPDAETLYITHHWNNNYQYDFYEPLEAWHWEYTLFLFSAFFLCFCVKIVQKLKTR